MLEFVTPVHPIVPILNGLLGLLIHPNTFQLHQRNGKLTLFPPDHHKHVMLTIVSRGHFHHLNFLSRLQRRGRAANNTPGFNTPGPRSKPFATSVGTGPSIRSGRIGEMRESGSMKPFSNTSDKSWPILYTATLPLSRGGDRHTRSLALARQQRYPLSQTRQRRKVALISAHFLS